MYNKLNYFPVNWVDGMKINKSHFIATQDNVADVARDVMGARLNKINYGLLPVDNGNESLKIALIIDNHKLFRIKIEECHAVTPNGSRIEISSKSTHVLNMVMAYSELANELKEKDEVVLLANITVNPFSRNPFGEPDLEENPPRYPYVLPTYNLNLVPENDLYSDQDGYQLTLGKIIIKSNETRLETNYIPPCTSVQSHQNLINIHTEIDSFFGQLELLSVQISQKINRKNQSSDLSQTLLILCDKINDYLGQIINSFRWFSLQEPPSYMFDKIIGLGRVIKNYMDSKSGAGKEELLNYFSDWCGLSQGDFEVMFTDLVNSKYHHMHIDKTVLKVSFFMETLSELLSVLNRLDYIGKQNNTGVFVKERPETKSNFLDKSKRIKSFLKD